MLAKGSRLKDFYYVKTYDNSISDIWGALLLVILQAYMDDASLLHSSVSMV